MNKNFVEFTSPILVTIIVIELLVIFSMLLTIILHGKEDGGLNDRRK